MFQTEGVEKMKHTFYVQYFFFEKLDVYEIMWKNMVKPERPQANTEHALVLLDN
jgi:hypothetical protein